LWCFRGESYRVSRVAFTAAGRQALGGRTVVCAVQHWDLETGQELPGFSGAPHRPFWAVAFTGDGRRALTAGQDGMLRVWNVSDGRELGAFAGPLEAVHGLAISPDARLAASAGGGHYPDLDQGPQQGTDFTIRLWDLEAGKEQLRLKGHETYVWAVAFSPDGRRLLSCGAAGALRLWDTRSGEKLHTFHGHATSVSAVAFSADGRLALSGSSDTTVRLWDVASGRERCRFRGHAAGVRCVAFAPDGRHVLSGGEDATVRLWAVPEEATR
jgi:WD40 repeat protein